MTIAIILVNIKANLKKEVKMTLSFLVSNQDIAELFEKIKAQLKNDEQDACSILQKLKEIAKAFSPEEISQANNFQTKYLEIKGQLICSEFGRYNAEIMRAIEEIICPESHTNETRKNPSQGAKMIISDYV